MTSIIKFTAMVLVAVVAGYFFGLIMAYLYN
jgi:hypothetical protein